MIKIVITGNNPLNQFEKYEMDYFLNDARI